MNSLIRWENFRDLDTLSKGISSLFSHAEGASAWSPPVDVIEDEHNYQLKVELPEVKKEDIKVAVENGMIAISGERKFEREEKDSKKTFHRIERAYGAFQRSFELPDDVDGSKVQAEFKEGILVVSLPKS